MAHPQTSPRGFVAHKRIDVGSSQITYNTTGMVLSGGIKISNKAGGVLSANNTGLTIPGIYIGTHSTGITADGTGIMIGTNYITTNTIGN